MSRKWLLLGVVCLLLKIAAAEELRLLQFSDVHAGGPHAWPEALQEATREGLALKSQAILLTGDDGDNSFDVNGFHERYARDLQYWHTALKDYPGQIFLCSGNDDVAHNYQTEPQDLEQQWLDYQTVFGKRNYLNVLGNGISPSQLGGMRWISINSQIFSPLNHTPEAAQQAYETFTWLKQTLGTSLQPVVILCHIPPSWDLYTGSPGWKIQYLKQLRDLLAEYPGKIIIISGHRHRNHVQAMRPERPIPILTSGALATKYGYGSNWRDYVWQVDQQGIEKVEYTLHYIQHPDWTVKYEFEPDHMSVFLDQLSDNAAFLSQYICDIYGHSSQWQQRFTYSQQRQDILKQFWVQP